MYTVAVQMVVSHHVVAGNWTQDLCSLWAEDLFIIICKYTVAVFRHTPEKGIRAHYGWLWATMWLLRFELRTFGRAVSALNRWAIPPALELIFKLKIDSLSYTISWPLFFLPTLFPATTPSPISPILLSPRSSSHLPCLLVKKEQTSKRGQSNRTKQDRKRKGESLHIGQGNLIGEKVSRSSKRVRVTPAPTVRSPIKTPS